MELDIVLLPPKALSQKIGRLVKKLDARYGLAVAVDNKQLLPHISLLHLKTKPGRIKKIISATLGVGRRHKAFQLNFTKPRAGQKFFVIDLKNTSPLYVLHLGVVKAVAKFRTGKTDLRASNSWDKNYFKQYGVANILKNFRPHITLGAVKNLKHMDKIFSEIEQVKLPKFTAKRLAVTRVNKYHQVTKIIKEFKL